MKFKARLRHCLLVVYYLLGRTLKDVGRQMSRTRVLVFHHLDEPKRFEKLVCRLKKDYNVISFDSYLAGFTDETKINLVLAFDDGYKSWYSFGEPIFRKHNIKPIFFVNSDFIDLDNIGAYEYCRTHINTWEEGSLGWGDLANLKKLGCSIGGHSLEHTDLTDLNVSEAQLLDCVAIDKKKIDKELSQDTTIFAYPYGRWDEVAVDAVSKAGYKYAFTSDSGYLEDSISELKLLRTNVGMRDFLVARAYIEGCSEILTSDMAKLRSLARVF